MTNGTDVKQLCKALLEADGENRVVELLREAGYWDRPEMWRYYGDVENNWGQGGNQQRMAEAALAEKIVNSVDARLMNECRMTGIDPESDAAPPSVRAAIAWFFEEGAREKIATGGYVEQWSASKVREVAQGITLCTTGTRPRELNITIADCGEGQSARRLPSTILSLNKSNKMYVPFVQGQFNQGGTGALRFCGEHNLQLVVSRRNPDLMDGEEVEAEDYAWCFSIVRRERPTGRRKNSVYTYLAPLGVLDREADRQGTVLTFGADSFGIFPNDTGPYSRQVAYGTAIKLYDYAFSGDRSNILRGTSLLSRLDLLLPEIGLPVRVYEYRTNRNGDCLDVGSRRTTLSGLLRRIRDSQNVENGFPIRLPLQPKGERLLAHVFAFVPEGSSPGSDGASTTGRRNRRLGGARSYRKSEGVLFLRNGQTQGALSKDFFRREGVKMKPLADDLLVFVECDELRNDVREDLFMPSRDRLAQNAFQQTLVDELEKTIRECSELRDLRNRRQQERMSARLEDEKPLADVLESVIKTSPNLRTLLQRGQRIAAPFSTRPAKADEREFKGAVYPSFFKYKGSSYGSTVSITRPINQRVRLTFETDARDDYFTRPAERGVFDLTWIDVGGKVRRVSMSGPNLRAGIATVTLDLPDEATVGGAIEFASTVTDPSNAIEAFETRILLTVAPPAKERSSGGRGRRQSPGEDGGRAREKSLQVALPEIKRVYQADWESNGFDEATAMKVVSIGYAGEGDEADLYEFKVNMDNVSLLAESKQRRLSEDESALLREQFLYANVLLGLALLLDQKDAAQRQDRTVEDTVPDSVEDRIERTSRAMAPFVPAMVSLGASELELAEGGVDGLEEIG